MNDQVAALDAQIRVLDNARRDLQLQVMLAEQDVVAAMTGSERATAARELADVTRAMVHDFTIDIDDLLAERAAVPQLVPT